jgi:hypothetical protein
MKKTRLTLKGGSIMKNKLFTLLAVLLFLSSSQLLASDPCDVTLYKSIKAKDVTGAKAHKGYVFIKGNSTDDIKITNAEEMFERILGLCMEFNTATGKGKLTWTKISPAMVIDATKTVRDETTADRGSDGNLKSGIDPVEQIPVQSYLDPDINKYYVSVGRSTWSNMVDNAGTENAVMAAAFYDVLEKAAKFHIVSNASDFAGEKANIIDAVGRAEASVTACLDATGGSPKSNPPTTTTKDTWSKEWTDAGSDNKAADAALKDLAKLTSAGAADMATQKLFDGYYDLVKGKVIPPNFAYPCFNAVVSGSATATTNKHLNELGDLTALDVINIINYSSYFTADPLNTYQGLCTLDWVLTAFKNSADASNEEKLKDVASAVVNKFGNSKDKVAYTAALESMIKNNDPNAPAVLLGFLQDQSSKISLKDIDTEVIKNEIYKMTKVPTVKYPDAETFNKVTLPKYFADAYGVADLVTALSSLKDDGTVINNVIDALMAKYAPTTEFKREQLAAAIKGLINKDKGATATFVDLFKRSFSQADPSIVTQDVVDAIGNSTAESAKPVDDKDKDSKDNKGSKDNKNSKDSKDKGNTTGVSDALKDLIKAFITMDNAKEANDVALRVAYQNMSDQYTKDKTTDKDKLKASMKEILIEVVTAHDTYWSTHAADLKQAVDDAFTMDNSTDKLPDAIKRLADIVAKDETISADTRTRLAGSGADELRLMAIAKMGYYLMTVTYRPTNATYDSKTKKYTTTNKKTSSAATPSVSAGKKVKTTNSCLAYNPKTKKFKKIKGCKTTAAAKKTKKTQQQQA